MKFLADVNLPKYFSFFNQPAFEFVVDIDIRLLDTQIWEYALTHNLVILTKDTDFYNRVLISTNSPKVVYFKLGNVTLKQLHEYFSDNWPAIIERLPDFRLIIAYPDRLEMLR